MNRLVIIIATITVVSFFHLWRITDIPRGYYCDELSIGYNALLIAETGHDEHNQPFPVFFEAFGEFKNPLFIYAVSVIYKFFGISEFGLRVTSFLFFTCFLLGFYFLVKDVFKDNTETETISIYGLLTVGFLPFFFTISRISFEVISQLTMVIYSLLFIRRTYDFDCGKKWRYPILAGLFVGASVYSYSTARLLTFLLVLSLLLVYFRKTTFIKTIVIIASFFVSIIPYLIFSINNPGALVERFKKISYLYDQYLSIHDKILFFIKNYVSYFGFDFLLFVGDKNLRHSTGYGGEIYIIVFFLLMIGLIGLLVQKKLYKDRFVFFIFINFVLSPVAGSLTGSATSGEVPHLLRGILIGLYISFFSCWGMSYLLMIKSSMTRNFAVILVFALLVLQIGLYLDDYFTVYPWKTIGCFETYDFKDALISAIKQNPKKIIISKDANQPRILAEFYSYFISNPRNIPLYLAAPIPEKDACVISFAWNKPEPNALPCKFSESRLPSSVVLVKCY